MQLLSSRTSRILTITVLMLSSSFFAACSPNKNEPSAGKAGGTVKPAAKPDDADAVAKLEKAGAKLQKGSSGSIETVDMREAGGGNAELFAAAAKLPNLRTIVCTGPDVNDEAIGHLKGHNQLQRLNATDRSDIGDAGAQVLSTLPNVFELTLERASITDAAYPHLAKMKKLRILRANLTGTSDVGVKALADATQIELLDFRDCTGVSDEGIAALSKLTKMRSFKVWGKQITDKSLKVISSWTNLSSLGFQDTAISGSGGALSSLTKLNDVDAFRSEFNDEGLKSITASKGIKTLKLRNCLVTADGLKELAKFANLERLDLSESAADDSTLEAIAGLGKLIELELWLTRVSDAGLVHLTKLPLQTLTLEDIYDVSDAGLDHVGKIKTLKSLTLSKTGVTDDGLMKLAGLENLRELYLDNTTVSKKGVEALKAKLPKLGKVSY